MRASVLVYPHDGSVNFTGSTVRLSFPCNVRAAHRKGSNKVLHTPEELADYIEEYCESNDFLTREEVEYYVKILQENVIKVDVFERREGMSTHDYFLRRTGNARVKTSKNTA